MALSYGAIGTGAAGTTSCTPSYPTTISALTSELFCVVTGRSSTANTAPTMPAGWTSVLDFEGGTGTWGVDTGTRRVTIFKKDSVTGTETGTVTVSLAGNTNNTLYASIVRVEKASGASVVVQQSTGADITNGTAFSATGSTALDLAPGDFLLLAIAQCIDTGTQSAISLTASGITFGTRTNRRSTAVTNGNDHRHIIDTVSVSSGTATSAPTYAYTISAAGSGPVGFLRIREVLPPAITVQPTDQTVTEGSTATFTVTDSGSITSRQWQKGTVSGGGGSITLGAAITAATDGSGTSLASLSTASYNQAAGNAIIVRVKWEGTATPPTSVTDTAGNTYVARTATINGTSGVQIFDCLNCLGNASNVITVNWSSAIANYILLAPIRLTVTGGSLSYLDRPTTGLTGTGTNVTTGAFNAGDFAVSIIGTVGTGATGTANTGWTEDVEQGPSVGSQSYYRLDSPGGTYTAGATLSTSSPYAVTAASYSLGGSISWANVTDGTGGTTTSYTTPATTLSNNGTPYRYSVTGPGGTTYSNTVYLFVNAASTQVKYWNGSAWVTGVLKYWNGSAWVTGTLKYYNGSTWV